MSLGLHPLGLVALGLLEDGSGDVTVALTGVSATGQVGNLSAPAVVEPAGFALVPMGLHPLGLYLEAAAAGGDVTIALTGVQATTTLGEMGPVSPNALTGVAATAAVGTLVPSISVGLTAVSGSGSAHGFASGSPALASLGLNPLGLAALGLPIDAPGAPVDTVTLALTGVAASGAVGTMVPEVQCLLVGHEVATGEQGSIAPSLTVGLAGVPAVTQLGGINGWEAIGPSVSVEHEYAVWRAITMKPQPAIESEHAGTLLMLGGSDGPVVPTPPQGGGKGRRSAAPSPPKPLPRVRAAWQERHAERTRELMAAICAIVATGVLDEMTE